MLEVDEYSLKERFDMKYSHQVSYLRDAYGVDKHRVCLVFCKIYFGVCPSYCCLSGTMCGPVIVQYFGVYHYITVTAAYLVQRIIAACEKILRNQFRIYIAVSSEKIALFSDI